MTTLPVSWFIPLYSLYFILLSDLCVQSAILLEHLKFTSSDTVELKLLHRYLNSVIFKYKNM